MAYRNYGPNAGYVVAKDGTGDFLTIGSALTAASSLGGSGTLYLKAGTYTENPALIVGWNLVAWDADALTPNVIINGKCTYSGSGSVSISGISLQTNSDFFLSVTGANPSIVNLTNCYLNCLNNTGINNAGSANATINCNYCQGNIATTGIAFFALSNSAGLGFVHSNITNTGGSITASTVPGTSIAVFYHSIFQNGISVSSSGSLKGEYSSFDINTLNVTSVTHAGSGSSTFYFCTFNSGVASSIIVTSPSIIFLYDCIVQSTNTNAISGTGTLNYSNINFIGTSSKINASTIGFLNDTIGNLTVGNSTILNLTGVLIGNGTSAVTGNAVTQHDVLVGGSSNAITSVAPSATSGVPLISQGSSSDPAFGTAVVAGGGTGAVTLTGLLTGNGTSAITATAITQYNVITGGASNAPNSVAPSATSGVPLISQGSSSQPVFGTSVVAGGGTGIVTTTAYGLITGGTTATGNFQNAGTGATGQFYQSGGSASLGTWVGAKVTGVLVEIQTQTASNSASLTFTSGITSTYNNYLLLVSNYLPVTSNTWLTLQISTNAGVSYLASGYKSASNFNVYNSASYSNANTTTSMYVTLNCDSSGTGYTTSSVCYLQDFTVASTVAVPKINGQSTSLNSGNPYSVWLTGINTTAVNTAVNAFKLLSSSGNLSTGTFTLYGILE